MNLRRESIEMLDFGRLRSQVLPIFDGLRFDIDEGPWITGGILWRALANRLENADVDVVFASHEQAAEFRSSLVNAGWTSEQAIGQDSHGSDNPSMWAHPASARPLNVAASYFYPNLGALFACFDIRVNRIATDGRTVVYDPRAFEDLKAMRLHVTRPTRSARIEKYMGYGFAPYQFDHVLDASVRGYVDDSTPWREVLGTRTLFPEE